MIILLSGEGPSDLGESKIAAAISQGEEIRFGPLSLLIDQIAEHALGYSPLQTWPQTYRYCCKQELVVRSKGRRSVALPGKKRSVETGFYFINAWMLGEVANHLERAENDAVVAFLFRDADGTASSPASEAQRKFDSMIAGFERSGFERAVPMLPQPKSEAWFLCMFKDQPYQHCAAFEALPGNDGSPRSAKAALASALGIEATTEVLVSRLETNPADLPALAEQMPSFARFHERALEAFQSLR
ncbi:hypothetical protein [Pseudomonas sp. KNUC1026]|uniref:hypothetical protein n=1 Tax=Pseudomonas sp. KNUC1026 TaxID=2893890 RepID=UPI001F350B1A|nr:hypothetical protein [Pseudomonas sp. KNUC1026]UFH50680.1 hypothetical protein LN139_05795 [Pseudomonas sp. KNUC1026]